MKRGFSFILLAAGVIAACRVTSLNHPVSVVTTNDTISPFGYYYNENGALIHVDSNAEKEGYFVIKTKKSSDQMFRGRYGENTTVLSEGYEAAKVNGISVKDANDAETYLRRGNLDEVKVQLNIIPILDNRTMRRLLDTINSRFNYNDTAEFREYGGFLKKDHSFTFKKGEVADPCSTTSPGVDPGKGGITDYFHTHPGGVRRIVESDGSVRTCSFVQAVSRRDQDEMRNAKMGYVFAMRDSFQRIYIYDSTGIQATLPFEYWKSKYNK